jgi:peptide/nickel transport system substrate-binding protein
MTFTSRTRVKSLVGLLLSAGLIATACNAPAAAPSGSAASGAPAGGAGTVTLALAGEPTTLDPQSADDGNERVVSDNVYETLLWRDSSTMELGPLLATEWKQQEANSWRFTLRTDVTFTNGEPFNADSVVFSVKRIIDPALKSVQLSYLSSIVDAKKVDDHTVDIITNGPDPILPARMYWMKMVPAEYASSPDFASKPVGTGPYKFVEWRKGQDLTLTANADYWGDAPAIKDVTIRFIPSALTQLSALKSGEVDLVRNIDPEHQAEAPKTEHIAGIEFSTLRLNALSGPFSDVKVRQAAYLAVDKEALASSLFGGTAEVAQGQILRKDFFGYNPNLTAYPYDPAKAKELLGGREIPIEITGVSGRWLHDKEMVETLASMLEQVGFKPTVKILEFGAWLDVLLKPGSTDALFHSASGELFDADRLLQAHICGQSTSMWCNEEFTKLVADAQIETDVAKRQTMYEQATQLMYDEANTIVLLNPADLYGLSERLQWKPRTDAKIIVKDMSLTQ